jgi:anthranilate synthase component I
MSNATVAEDPLSLHSAMRSFIADAITPISAFLALAQPGRSCLLESVEGTDRISRYSFIGIDYLESKVFNDDPAMLDGIRALIGKYELDTSALPFPGGAVCVFTYDAARQFEKIGPKLPSDIPFSDALVVVPGTWVVFDHFTHRVTLIGFARNAAEMPGVQARLADYERRLMTARASVPNEIRVRGEVKQSMDRPAFLDRVATAKHHIYEGDIYQLQVGIRFSAEIEGGTPFDFYRQIRALNPSPYMFYIEHGGEAVFGASPEFLVRLDGRRASMRPLAGTRSRNPDPDADTAVAAELLANEKERAEHVMLVDLGRNDLGAVATTGSVHVDELMIIERFSHVMHIVSNVVAELREDRDALDLFAATFPAGTVTGAPKIRAMQIIDTLEPVGRNFYAGSIAHFHFDGDMDSCITLRCVAVANGKAYWQASAGIVADSDPAAEYDEIQHKTGVVRAVLGLPK